MQLIDNLGRAQVGQDGLISKESFANQMVSSGNFSEKDIREKMKTEEFQKFKTFVLEGK